MRADGRGPPDKRKGPAGIPGPLENTTTSAANNIVSLGKQHLKNVFFHSQGKKSIIRRGARFYSRGGAGPVTADRDGFSDPIDWGTPKRPTLYPFQAETVAK